MPDFEYFRPNTVEKALELMKRARPLGGGTELTPRRHTLPAVVDLQDLDLAGREPRGARLALGGGLRLQALIDGMDDLPNAVAHACRLEAGWNLRNQATLAGCVVSGDGRSPLLTTLLALGTFLEFEPGASRVTLDAFLAWRPDSADGRLITWVEVSAGSELRFASVGRSPADRPIVCAAVCRTPEDQWQVVLGGHGAAPIRVAAAETALGKDHEQASIDAVAMAASEAYAQAEDRWASGEYRGAVAGVLVRRLAAEIRSA